MQNIMKKYWAEFKIGTKTMFKEFFNKDTNKKQRANMWTFTRLITPLITLISSIIAIITNSIPLLIITSFIAGFGALTDKFDGMSAKKHKSFSQYGKVLDQVTDKSFAGIIGINLLFLNFNYVFVLLGELTIALVNISYKLKDKNLNIDSTLIGKIKQTPLFLSLALGYLSSINSTLLLISNISIVLTVLFQSATSISYIKNNNDNIKRNKIKNNNIVEEIEIENLNKSTQLTMKKQNEKVRSIENNDISRTQQCEKLKKLRDELVKDTNIDYIEKNSFQKIKK